MNDEKKVPNSSFIVPRSSFPSDAFFLTALVILGGLYVGLIVAMLTASLSYTSKDQLLLVLANPTIQYAIKLSLLSCTITTILSLWLAVPLAYLMSRYQFRGKALLDALLDVPIVLPPLVVGLCLLMLFVSGVGRAVIGAANAVLPSWLQIDIVFAVPSVIIAQLAVACAFAVRTLRVTFDQINPRAEQVALTLGCSRNQAFWRVVLPEARRGLLTAATLVWARSLGEFGPILVFSGATQLRTEVLSTTVFLELSVGHLDAALAVSFLMIAAALVVLIVARAFGVRGAAPW
jgi:molybdate transport system permease protein